MTIATSATVEWLKTNRAALEGVMAGLPGPVSYDSLVLIAETQAANGGDDPHAGLVTAIHAYHEATAGRAVEEWILIVEQRPKLDEPDIVMASSMDSPAHAVGILTIAADHVTHRGGFA